jgi:hypothetical protein
MIEYSLILLPLLNVGGVGTPIIRYRGSIKLIINGDTEGV